MRAGDIVASKQAGTAGSETVSVDVVTLEDLLYNLPDAERPRVSVRTLDAVTGQHVTKLVPLRPEHIYVVKCDVEGFDVPVLHSLKRLFAAPIESRPVALTAEFTPRVVAYKDCDAAAFTSFLYEHGYRYVHGSDVLDWDAMSVLVEASRTDQPKCVRTFEGWWKLGASSAATGTRAVSSALAAPVLTPVPVSALATAATTRSDSTGTTHDDFCAVSSAGERKPSVFHAAPPPNIRAASVNARSNNATATQVMASYLDALSTTYPCFWADYKIPSGHTIRICTHDPKVDVGVSGRIHKYGSFFQPSTFMELKSFMRDGVCPPDRPVVLDLGLNIGSFSLLALELGCQVVAFDMLAMNVNRVVQTVSVATDADGTRWLDRFHGYINGLR
jgi:hypothetical protein